MTIRYRPDTCSCIIDIEHGTNKYVNWVQKCPGHADKDGQDLTDAIFTHNRSFQISVEDQKDQVKRNANVKTKHDEKIRIEALGSVVLNANNKAGRFG